MDRFSFRLGTVQMLAVLREWKDQKVNFRERIAKKELEREGWKVQKVGWPDFLCWRRGELKAVEVKAPDQVSSTGLTEDQENALYRLGQYLPAEVRYINTDGSVFIRNCSSPKNSAQIARMTAFEGLGLGLS